MSKPTNTEQPVVCLISLGCAKNTVDSERILGLLASSGFLIAEDPADAQLCLVNTCGFIQDAREETAAVLRELSELKKNGSLRAVAALGCMVQRANEVEELAHFLSLADARIAFSDYPRLPDICRRLIEGTLPDHETGFPDFVHLPRLRIGAPHTAYLKISEGCSNPCSFCCIPQIRGRQVSLPIETIVEEARSLIRNGAKEINFIAQDTTSYGKDLYGTFRLPELLRAVRKIQGDVWFRLMYAYPKHLSVEILKELAADPRFCRYIDLPLQHISDPVLSAMNRGFSRKDTVELLDRIEKQLPGAAIRTAFIVGFPNETENDFEELLTFVREGRFTHVGAFAYSSEPRTPAAQMDDRISPEEKINRCEQLMLAQLNVSKGRLRRRVGGVEEVLVDGTLDVKNRTIPGVRYVGRTKLEAPEVDGVILMKTEYSAQNHVGQVVHARIVDSLDYDLVAEI